MKDVYVIDFQHIDFQHDEAEDMLVIPASKALALLEDQLLPCAEKDATFAFKQAGWDGDGPLGIIWLPRFVFAEADGVENEGECLWHVKQSNNGTSWLLASRPFRFPFVNALNAWKTIQLQEEPLMR